MKNSIQSCAQSPVMVSGSELRQEGFSWGLHYLLVSTIRIWRQIANEMLLKFKTEFFNRIGQYFPLELPGCFPELAVHQQPLSANGEVCYTVNTSRSKGCFRGIIKFR